MLRRLGVLKEGREILKNDNLSSMVKVWLALEVRLFINASIQDVRMARPRRATATNRPDPRLGQGRHAQPECVSDNRQDRPHRLLPSAYFFFSI